MHCYVPANIYLVTNVIHVYTKLYKGLNISKSDPNVVNHFQNQEIPMERLVTFASVLFSALASIFGENFNIILVS